MSSGELRDLLRGLGLQPSSRDVQTIMGELAIPHTASLRQPAQAHQILWHARLGAPTNPALALTFISALASALSLLQPAQHTQEAW